MTVFLYSATHENGSPFNIKNVQLEKFPINTRKPLVRTNGFPPKANIKKVVMNKNRKWMVSDEDLEGLHMTQMVAYPHTSTSKTMTHTKLFLEDS